MKFALLACLVMAMPSLCGAETVKLRSGQEQSAKVLSIDANSVTLEGAHKPLARKDVLEIQFAASKIQTATAAVSGIAPTAQDKKDAAAYFAQAEKLAAQYPDVNGIILLNRGEYIYNADGTNISRYHEVHRILKESLKQYWGQAAICGEEGRERVSITKASVYTPEGNIYPLDPSKIQIVHPQNSSSQFFSSGKVCAQYSMPGVQVGDIVDYQVESEEYNPFKKGFFFPEWSFQNTAGPTGLSDVSITLPAGQDFTYSATNFPKGEGKPVKTSADGATTWYWKLENVPPMVDEPMMPPYADVAPFLLASVQKSWDPIIDWVYGYHSERATPSPELAAFTLDMVKDCKTQTEKATKIYHYVQKEIRYIALKIGIASGYGGYDATLTWKRGYGCCVDKAILLAAMLRAAGIQADPVLINPNMSQDFDLGVPHLQFGHSITVAQVDGKHLFLDSVGYDYRYPEIVDFDYGGMTLDSFTRKFEAVPVPAPADNARISKYSVEISSGGDTAVNAEYSYTGSNEAEMRNSYRSIKREEQEQSFQSMSKAVDAQSRLVSWHVDNAEKVELPFTLGLDYAIVDYPKRAGDIRIFTLPAFAISNSLTQEISLDKRVYPIKYGEPMGRYSSYAVKLPPNYEVVSLPGDIKLKTKGASFGAGCKQHGATVLCHMDWERSTMRVQPRDYDDYKRFLEAAASYAKQQLFFRDKAAH